ncbi:MAG: 4'-phosphopantetheinyl transferase superfamily protein [Burkholderiales bacterium]|nr:MAG: 4'-phosphopantetheinyl transferase superfamily protein [Burkholderiales bacterium]
MSMDATMPAPQTWEPRSLVDAPARGLEDAELHFWLLPLELPAATLENLTKSLTAEELARASRYRFERDRRHFIAARSLLRDLVGRYAGVPSDGIRFRLSSHGKPSIDAGSGLTKLEFNLSHSGEWALAGFARGSSVGVDIELARDMPDLIDVARNTFSAGEAALIEGMRADQQVNGFFRCWTRKESYVKAVGAGFSLDLKAFDVTVDQPLHIDRIRNIESGLKYKVEGVRPLPGYWAATAVEMPERVDARANRSSKYFTLAT